MYDFLQTSLNLPYRVNLSNLTEIRHTNGSIKHIRRVQQAPYPLTKVTSDVELFGILEPTEKIQSNTVPRSRHTLYQSTAAIQLNEPSAKPTSTSTTTTKSKKLFPNLVKSKQQAASTSNDSSIQTQSPSSSSNSSSTKLARQIFNNLNIFSNKHQNDQPSNSIASQSKPASSSSNSNSNSKQEQASSLRRNLDMGQQNVRRLSSKSNSSTASTQNLIVSRRCRRSYRSQDDDFYLETDGSSCYSTTNSLSGGRDGFCIRRPSVDTISTYLSHESNERLQYSSTDTTYTGDDDVFLPQQHKVGGSIVGVDADSDMISRFVNVIHPPAWPNYRPCAICLEELRPEEGSTNPAVSLIRCEHLMHLSCLNHLIISQSEQQKKSTESNGKPTLYIECPVCGIVYGEKYGNQPLGTMTWSIIPKQLAGHEGQNTIQIIYK